MRLINADALKEKLYNEPSFLIQTLYDVMNIVNSMPTVQPERKKGHWQIYIISMLDGEGCKCSECGHEGAPYWDFCPNCGAEMEGEQDG